MSTLSSLPCSLLGLPYADAVITGPSDALASRYPVTDLLTGSVVAAGLAYAQWCGALGERRPTIAVDTRAVAVAAASQSHARVAGRPVGEWAPLSGWALAGDGWMRLHANYAHHRDALCRVLGILPDRVDMERAVRGWETTALETALAAAGGVGVRVRTRAEWAAGEPGRAAAELPLLSVAQRGTAGPVGRGPGSGRPPRVLDLSRVIAGPVGTRMLGLLGCDVLRIDAPDRPEQDLHADTGLAKRSALVDLRRDRIDELVADADVVVSGYRPGALRALGLDDAIAANPRVVVVELSAWGSRGPWAARRGFDSLVQAATGIADEEADGDRPGALPVQALDHATGYLVAACAWHGLAARMADGRSCHYRLSLVQTADWLGAPRPQRSSAVPLRPQLQVVRGGYGETTVVAPPLQVDGLTPRWPAGAQRPGGSEPVWGLVGTGSAQGQGAVSQ